MTYSLEYSEAQFDIAQNIMNFAFSLKDVDIIRADMEMTFDEKHSISSINDIASNHGSDKGLHKPLPKKSDAAQIPEWSQFFVSEGHGETKLWHHVQYLIDSSPIHSDDIMQNWKFQEETLLRELNDLVIQKFPQFYYHKDNTKSFFFTFVDFDSAEQLKQAMSTDHNALLDAMNKIPMPGVDYSDIFKLPTLDHKLNEFNWK